MATITETKKKLVSLHDELTRRSNAINIDTHHKNEPVEKDFAEQVTQRENDDVLSAIGDETQQTVKLINKALARIEQGTYGTCERCGEPIAEARLEALPYATTCIKCAQ